MVYLEKAAGGNHQMLMAVLKSTLVHHVELM
jgi:hypothetical protein